MRSSPTPRLWIPCSAQEEEHLPFHAKYVSPDGPYLRNSGEFSLSSFGDVAVNFVSHRPNGIRIRFDFIHRGARRILEGRKVVSGYSVSATIAAATGLCRSTCGSSQYPSRWRVVIRNTNALRSS